MIRNASDIERTADELGSHFFSPGAMRCFKSHLLNIFRALNDDGTRRLFVTSERFDSETPREYRVRLYHVTHRFEVDTLEVFATRAQAETYVRNYSEAA